MTPTQQINESLAAFRAEAGMLLPKAEVAMQRLEMLARTHAVQLVTREEYLVTVEAKARVVEALKARIVALEGDPRIKAERVAKLREQQASITAELTELGPAADA